jgi:hypothetical protein
VTGLAILGDISSAPLGGGHDGVPAAFGIVVFLFLVVFVIAITLAAAFVASAPGGQPGQGPASAETRIREVRALQSKGLITPEQAEARVDEILKGI